MNTTEKLMISGMVCAILVALLTQAGSWITDRSAVSADEILAISDACVKERVHAYVNLKRVVLARDLRDFERQCAHATLEKSALDAQKAAIARQQLSKPANRTEK
jgi:hypothetical protein